MVQARGSALKRRFGAVFREGLATARGVWRARRTAGRGGRTTVRLPGEQRLPQATGFVGTIEGFASQQR